MKLADVLPGADTAPGLINRGIRTVPVEELVPHPHNPNVGDLKAIRASIRANGFWGHVVVRELPDGRFQSLAGWHRAQAAAAEGIAEVPVVVVEADEVLAVRILLADNETARRGSYDQDVLDGVLEGLESLEGTGFELLADLEPVVVPDDDEDDDEVDGGLGADDDDGGKQFVSEYGVIVIVADEAAQAALYEELVAAGHDVRIASI